MLAVWPGSSAQAQQAVANVRVATMPVTNFTPLLVARDKGWFAEENLNVTWTIVPQGAIAVEAVFGGSAEFGGGAILEPMIARGNGLDISFVVPTTRSGTNRRTIPACWCGRRQHPLARGPRRQDSRRRA